MTWWSGTRLVIGREMAVRIRTKSFLISTIVMVLFFGVVIALPAITGVNRYAVGVVPQTAAIGQVVVASAKVGKVEVTLKDYPDAATATEAVRSGEVDAAVLRGGEEILAKKQPATSLVPFLIGATSTSLQNTELRKHGVDPTGLEHKRATIVALEPQKTNAEGKRIEAFFVMVLLLSQVGIYAGTVAQGVVEEKQSRVIEVLVAAIKPAQILVGKIIGIGLVSLVQLVALATIGLSAGTALGAISLDSTDVGVIVQVLPWFLIAYIFTATLYAGVAATVSRTEDLNSALGPLSLIFIVNAVAGQLGISKPDQTAVHVLSYVPPVSPVLMVERWAGGAVGSGQVALSMGIMALATIAVAWVSSKVYLERILHFGARVPLRTAFLPGRKQSAKKGRPS